MRAFRPDRRCWRVQVRLDDRDGGWRRWPIIAAPTRAQAVVKALNLYPFAKILDVSALHDGKPHAGGGHGHAKPVKAAA